MRVHSPWGGPLLWLSEYGVDALNQRQLNAVIEGANLIVATLDAAHQPAGPGMGLAAWLRCDETGRSSRYLAHCLAPHRGLQAPPLKGSEIAYPHDPGDFGRCVGLLDAEPDLRRHLTAEMSQPKHGPAWNALAPRWSELETLYREEQPTGQVPRLYDLLQQVIIAVHEV